MGRLSNISLADFRRFLTAQGLVLKSINGGHEKWDKEGLLRCVIVQTHISPVPEMVIRSNLRTIGVSANDLLEFLKK